MHASIYRQSHAALCASWFIARHRVEQHFSEFERRGECCSFAKAVSQEAGRAIRWRGALKPFQSSWDTDDGELSVSMTISVRNSIEVSVAVADEGVMIATSISDIDEMIDILTRCKRVAERYSRGDQNPKDTP